MHETGVSASPRSLRHDWRRRRNLRACKTRSNRRRAPSAISLCLSVELRRGTRWIRRFTPTVRRLGVAASVHPSELRRRDRLGDTPDEPMWFHLGLASSPDSAPASRVSRSSTRSGSGKSPGENCHFRGAKAVSSGGVVIASASSRSRMVLSVLSHCLRPPSTATPRADAKICARPCR